MKKRSSGPLIIGHRGASALAPENTLAAFRRAFEDGAEGIEFDVRLAKDGVPVVFHDDNLKRIGNRDGLVASFTSAELATVDAGSWFNMENPTLARSEFSRQTIPTLAVLFDFLKGTDGLLYLELKCRKDEISPLVNAVSQTIRESCLLPRIILKSFKLRAVALAKVSLPELYTAALFAPKIRNVFNKNRHVLEKAADCLADEISLHYSMATRKLVTMAQRRGLPTTIWTVDSPRWIKRSFNLGIRSVITNDPGRLIARRRIKTG